MIYVESNYSMENNYNNNQLGENLGQKGHTFYVESSVLDASPN